MAIKSLIKAETQENYRRNIRNVLICGVEAEADNEMGSGEYLNIRLSSTCWKEPDL